MRRGNAFLVTIILVAKSAVAGAEPPIPSATLPSTQPAEDLAARIVRLQKVYDGKLKDLERVTAESNKRFEASPEGKALLDRTARSLALLEAARRTDDLQGKLDASAVHNAAKTELDRARREAVSGDREVYESDRRSALAFRPLQMAALADSHLRWAKLHEGTERGRQVAASVPETLAKSREAEELSIAGTRFRTTRPATGPSAGRRPPRPGD